jgi:hypothetical protein
LYIKLEIKQTNFHVAQNLAKDGRGRNVTRGQYSEKNKMFRVYMCTNYRVCFTIVFHQNLRLFTESDTVGVCIRRAQVKVGLRLERRYSQR